MLPEACGRGRTIPSNIIPRCIAHVRTSSHAMYGVDVMKRSGEARGRIRSGVTPREVKRLEPPDTTMGSPGLTRGDATHCSHPPVNSAPRTIGHSSGKDVQYSVGSVVSGCVWTPSSKRVQRSCSPAAAARGNSNPSTKKGGRPAQTATTSRSAYAPPVDGKGQPGVTTPKSE